MSRSSPTSGASSPVLPSIARFVADTEAERLRLYRLHLQATVTRASPLTLDVAAGEGGLAAIADRLAPRATWPWSMAEFSGDAGLRPHAHAFRAILATAAANAPRSRRSPPRRWRGGPKRGRGVAVADPLFLVVGDRLEVATSVGPCSLQTSGPLASVALPDPLPEAVALSLAGRPIDALLDHPMLRDRGYEVVDVAENLGGGHVVTFAPGLLPLELPWGPELAAELRPAAMAPRSGTTSRSPSRHYALSSGCAAVRPGASR